MPRENQTVELGNLIRDYRSERGYTQRALAERIGVPYGDVARLEAGYYVQPNPTLLQKVARALGVDVEVFYEVANYPAVSGLPEVGVYTRLKYPGLPVEAADEARRYFQRLERKYERKKEGRDGG